MYGGYQQQHSSSLHLDPLFAQLGHYQNLFALKSDVVNLLQSQRSLRPKVDTFEGQGNQRVTLFYLHGTVPITFAGNTYNIPMTIYFDPPFPAQPPRCFVSPTDDMQIKPRHKHVDAKGMVYLPYLNQWQPGRSSCGELFMQIAQVFSQDPPVYSAPGSRSQPLHSQRPYGQQQQPQQQPQIATPVQSQGVVKGHVVSPPQGSPQGSPGGRKDVLINSLTAKAQKRIPVILQPIIDEINAQLDKQEELVAHRVEVESLITGLEAEGAKIERYKQELDDAEAKATSFLEQRSQEDFDVLAFLEPNDPLSRQLLDLVAEDLAYDDLLLFLEDNIQSRRITPARYMDLVRETSRKIFYCKELKKKVISTLRARQLPAS